MAEVVQIPKKFKNIETLKTEAEKAAQTHIASNSQVEPQPQIINTTPNPSPEQVPDPKPENGLSDDDFLKEYEKRTGKKIKSVDELKVPTAELTPEEKEAQIKAKKEKAFKWAIDNKKISQEQIEKAAIAKAKSDREIALELFAAEYKEENPKATPEEIATEFSEYNLEHLTEDSKGRKMRAKEIAKIADNYRKEYVAPVESIDSDYDSFETTQSKIKNYINQVDGIFETMPKETEYEGEFSHPNGSKVKIKVPYSLDEDDIKTLRKNLKNQALYDSLTQGKDKVNNKDILDAINLQSKAIAFDKIIQKVLSEAANKGSLETMAYLKGFPAAINKALDGAKPTTNVEKPKFRPVSRTA